MSDPGSASRRTSVARARAALVLSLLLSVGCQSTGGHGRTGASDDTTSAAPAAIGVDAHGAATADSVDALLVVGTTASDRAVRTRFDAARVWVEQRLDVALGEIGLAFAPTAVIEREVARETHRLVAAQFDDAALVDRLQADLARAQQGTYAAVYSARKSVVLVDASLRERLLELAEAGVRSAADDAQALAEDAMQALFVHELVHAADDARYDIVDRPDLDFRRSFTQAAVYEGHAQYRTREICARHDCLDGLALLERLMFDTATTLAAAGPVPRRFSNAALSFAYREGERFVAGLAAREGGAALLESALATPPLDPAQILVPSSYPDAAREARNQALLEHAQSVLHPWRADPFHMVAVSPLRGLSLDDRSERRAEVIDGLTRHAIAMVGVQIHEGGGGGPTPPEATLMQTTTESIAALFASSLHDEARLGATAEHQQRMSIRRGDGSAMSVVVQIATHEDPWIGDRTVVTASAGRHVVQVHDPRAVQDASSVVAFAVQFLRRAESVGSSYALQLPLAEKRVRRKSI